MSRPDKRLADRRAARNRARAEFQRRVGLAKVDLAPAVLKRRVVTEARRTTLSVAYQAMDIANDSRGIVAATAAALVLWLARKPVMAGAGKLLHRFRSGNSTPRSPGDRFKLLMDDYWQKLKEYADE